MNDIVPFLIRQAEKIATEGHNGWGNTMIMAVEEIERLRARNQRLEEALRRLITEVDNESPWRSWPDAKIRAFDMARIALKD